MTEMQALFRILARYMIKNGMTSIDVKISDIDIETLATKTLVIDLDEKADRGSIRLIPRQEAFKFQKDIN